LACRAARRRGARVHGITLSERQRDHARRRTPLTRLLNRYVFPDGELVRISDALVHMERAGYFRLEPKPPKTEAAGPIHRLPPRITHGNGVVKDTPEEQNWRCGLPIRVGRPSQTDRDYPTRGV